MQVKLAPRRAHIPPLVVCAHPVNRVNTADSTTTQAGTQYGYGRVPHNAKADDTGTGQGKRNP